MLDIKYRAIKYLRISDADEKSGESDSIANQRRIIDEYLKKHPEIEIVDEKIDDGKSGIFFDRPALMEMRRSFEEGKANCCITKDLSRLGREFSETLRHIREFFPKYGVRFIAINDNIDTLFDSADNLTTSIQSAFNDEYCRDISKKTRSALASKRANGEYVGSFPIYGYKKADDNRNQLVIDEYPAEIVRSIYRLKIEGLSAGRIADTLNSQEVLSPYQYKKTNNLPCPRKGYADKENTKWSAKTILRILRDETYTGTLVQGITGTPNYKIKEVVTKPSDEWKRVEKTHEPIIKRHLFDLTQKVLKIDTRTAPDGKSIYVFSGLIICGCCGGRMHRKSVQYKGNKTHYYYCRTIKKPGCDSSVMLREDDLTECVLAYIKNQVENVASLEKFIRNIEADKIAQGLAKNLTLQLSENEINLKKTREFMAHLDSDLINERLTKAQYKLLKTQYADEEDLLTLDNKRLKNEIVEALSFSTEQTAWIENFKGHENLESLDRKTVVNLIHSIKVNGRTDLEITSNYEAEYNTIFEIIKGDIA